MSFAQSASLAQFAFLRSLFSTSFVFLLLTALAPPLYPQAFTAQLTGTVKDSSGAVVPRANIIATAIQDGAVFTTTSNEDGVYRFPALRPMEYRVECSLAGFKKFQQLHVTLQVDQAFELGIVLQPGSPSEEITVTDTAPPLETANGTLAQVVTTRSIENLPLNVRDPMALVALTPGVQLGSNFGNGGGRDVGRNYFKSDFYIGGGRSGSEEILIDGAPDTTPDANKGVIDPPVDAVQEFAVQASSYSSQFGRTSGGVVNIVTKSGTNDIHGVAYDFERHSVLDANNWFNNRSRVPNPSFQRHQFGGNTGIPILKNRWFFFGDYEGLRQSYPLTSTDTVPTALQRTGDFSQTFTSGHVPILIYDPSTLVTLANGSRQRSVFPLNMIPASAISPVAAATLALYPQPNTTGTAVTNANNYIYTANSSTNSNKYDLRTDANLQDNTRMFARISRQQDVRSVPGSMPLPIGGGRNTTDTYTQAVSDITHVFSPSTVADLNVSFTRALAAQFGASQGFNLSSLKLPASYINAVYAQFPIFSMSDITGTSNGSDTVAQYQPRNVFAFLGNVSYQRGKHSFKFGSDIRLLHFNEGANNQPAGSFSFDRTFTQGPNPVQSSATAGYGLASFLLGDATSGTVSVIQPISTQGSYYGAFIQDDWKVTSKLTLNLGLRWDVALAAKEKYNRIAYFDPSAASPLASVSPALANLKGALNWIGNGNPSYTTDTNWSNFAPRFGLAYSIDSKTVLRGGYGMFFMPRVIQANGDGAVEAVRNTNMVATIDGVTPADKLNNPFPATNPIQPAANDRSQLANIGSAITLPLRPFKNGYAQTWSFEIQREMPWSIVLSVHYWGNKGTRLLADGGSTDSSTSIGFNINQLPDQYLSLGSHLNDLVPNPFYGIITTGALAGATISRRQSLQPFPQYTSVSQVFEPAGDSTYEAGTIQAEKRLSKSLTFLGAYTRSKAIDDIRTPLDVYNLRAEKGLSAFDAPNQFRLSFVYGLPVGRDRHFGNNLNRFVNAVLGDWDVDAIVNLQSGQPISISRPSVNNGQSAALSNPTIAEWFNTSVFTSAPAFTFGNVGPVLPDVRTDWTRNVDTVLVKNFHATLLEHPISTQFRFEVFNLFNTPQFGAPVSTVTSTTFGQVTSQFNAPRDIQFGLKVSF